MIKNYKHGAMFGLDARIALAIFGALSVISGAALYSAIQTAKTEQARQIFNEIIKASEAYYLDNGTPLPQSNAMTAHVSDLITNRESLSHWKGPYIDGTTTSSTSFENSLTAEIDPASVIVINVLASSDWADNSLYQQCPAVGDTDCSEWVKLYSGNTASGRIRLETLFGQLDKLIDNSDGDTTGNVRAVDKGGNILFLMYKGIPRKRTI